MSEHSKTRNRRAYHRSSRDGKSSAWAATLLVGVVAVVGIVSYVALSAIPLPHQPTTTTSRSTCQPRTSPQCGGGGASSLPSPTHELSAAPGS